MMNDWTVLMESLKIIPTCIRPWKHKILLRWIMAAKSFIETSLLKECFSITLLHMYTYHITCNICKLGCKKWIAMCRSNERKSIIGYTGQFEFGLLEDSGYVPLTEIITNKANLDTNKNYFYLKKAFLDFTLEYAILHHIQNIIYSYHFQCDHQIFDTTWLVTYYTDIGYWLGTETLKLDSREIHMKLFDPGWTSSYKNLEISTFLFVAA